MIDSNNNIIALVNISNPDELTMLKLVCGRSKITFMPLLHDTPKQKQPYIVLANEKLTWQNSNPLQDELKRTIKCFWDLLSQ